jgi:hypothetical protein
VCAKQTTELCIQTWRCGHFATPIRLHIFLKAVVHIPNLWATVCSGRWKCSRSTWPVIPGLREADPDSGDPVVEAMDLVDVVALCGPGLACGTEFGVMPAYENPQAQINFGRNPKEAISQNKGRAPRSEPLRMHGLFSILCAKAGFFFPRESDSGSRPVVQASRTSCVIMGRMWLGAVAPYFSISDRLC